MAGHYEETLSERMVMEGRMIVGSAEAQVRAVKAGFGVAQLATWLIEEELKKGELVELLPHMSTDGLPLHLVWPLRRRLSPKVDALISLMQEHLKIR